MAKVEYLDPFRWFVLGWLLEDGDDDKLQWKDSNEAQASIDELNERLCTFDPETMDWLRKQFDGARLHPKKKKGATVGS